MTDVTLEWLLLEGRGGQQKGATRRKERLFADGPADFVAFVLFVEPRLERSEVLEHRRRVHLVFAGQCVQRFRPRTALSHR